MPIDLTKLKALELPTKEIEVEILGETQKVKITCPGEDVAATIYAMYELRGKDATLSVDVVKVLLPHALPDLAIEDIDAIVKRDFKAATAIAAAARDLLSDFVKAKKICKEKTEKNLPEAKSDPVKNS